MAIAQDSQSTVFTESTPGTDGTRSNPSITIVSSTTVAYAIIGCGAQTSAATVTINADPTLGGTGMTRLQVRNPVAGAVAGTGGQIGIFRLVNPATGSNTLSYGWTGNCFQTWAYIVAYTGVHSTPEVQTIHDAVNTDGGTVTKDITSVVAGNLTLSAWGRGAQFGTVGGSSGATQRFKNNIGSADAMDNGAAASNASASGTVTHSWTSNTGSDRYAVIITEIQAAGASTYVPRPIMASLQAANRAANF